MLQRIVKSAKSIRSIKSLKSDKSSVGSDEDSDTDTVVVFENLLPETCMRFGCPYSVLVKKECQRDTIKMVKQEKTYKRKMVTLRRDRAVKPAQKPDSYAVPSTVTVRECDSDTIVVHACYDNFNRLVELLMSNIPEVPRVLIQTIGLLAPYYLQLNNISICKSRIDVYTIYELNKFLPFTNVTEVCLDGSYLPEGNYAILLEDPTRLKNLSLSRCAINDKVCQKIAEQLHYPQSAEKQLFFLNLSSNHVTDVGAKHLSEALRTNRHLRYLNLAGNRIGDDGANYIFSILEEFPLTSDEVIEQRKRHMVYLKQKRKLYLTYLSNCLGIQSSDESTKKTTYKKKKNKLSKGSIKHSQQSVTLTEEIIKTRADVMATEAMGPFHDLFSESNVSLKDEWSYSVGNMTLNYLNLAYNNLSFLSAKKLLHVLQHQSNCVAAQRSGLLKVVLEGNRMPVSCPELISIGNLLHKNMMRCSPKTHHADGRRRSHTVTRISSLAETLKYREERK